MFSLIPDWASHWAKNGAMNSSDRPEYTVNSVTSVACSLLDEHPDNSVAKRARTTANRADFLNSDIDLLSVGIYTERL
jgi:hypothetical protein